MGQLPGALNNRHFSPRLTRYILFQHHHCQTTQPLLLEQLREWGIDISSGQINQLLLSGQEAFHAEKEDLLKAGLATSSYVTVDDSGARHQGENVMLPPPLRHTNFRYGLLVFDSIFKPIKPNNNNFSALPLVCGSLYFGVQL